MDRKRRMMSAQSTSVTQQLMDGAPFVAQLTKTLALQRGTGSATFTRATTGSVQDHEGVLRTAIAGEARFTGARGVRNWIQAPTENWSNSTWTKSSISASGNRLTATGANGVIYDSAALGMGTGRTALASVTLSRVTGTGNIDISTNGGTTWTTVSVTGARVSVSLTGNINGQFAIRIVTSGDAIDATYPQLEDVTGRADQTTPSEYVSVGVASAPYYHGAGVDGVKYFDTDLSGNPLTTLKGYLAEGARTNLCVQSNSFTTTWSDGGAAAAQDATGPDGATSAWTLTDDSAVSTESRYQAITLTAAAHVLSIFVGKTVGAQSSYPALMLTHTGDTFRAIATIDTTNGVVTPWTAVDGFTIVTSTGRCVSYNDDLWRVELTFTGTAAAWNLYLIPAGTANATQSTGDFSAAITGSAVFYGAQVELGSFASSYIATTTIAVARNADALTYSSAGNILDAAGWCYAEYSSPAMTLLNAMAVVGDGGGTNRGPLLTRTITSGAHMFDGTNLNAGSAGTPANNVMLTAASTWGGGVATVGVDGVLGAQGSYDGSYGLTSLGIGYGAVNMFGTIRNVRIGQRQLSSSELQAITR